MIPRTIKIWLLVFTLLLAVLIAFIASPSLRFGAFRIVTELPAITTHFIIQKHVKKRAFSAISTGLERQLTVVQMTGTRRNSMVRGLLKNTEMVMGVADFSSDYAALTPFLRRFADYQPNLFMARVWLAKALSYTDPASAFEHLEEAIRIVPSDDRAYHIAVRASLALEDMGKARDWCERYQSARFGGTRPLLYRNIFAGSGLRKIALEISSDGVSIPVRVFNEGVVLGSSSTYSFDLPKRAKVKVLRLHLGLLPGVKVTLENMILFGPLGKQQLDPKELIILPEESFIIGERTLLTVSPHREVVTLRLQKGSFGPMDRIDMKINFKRAGLATLPGCEGHGL
jgi:hypothetical protein